MIRRLTLKNWRSYEDVTITFEAGTTFVVAPNGVGKTSLVEAARWALFGTIAEGHGAIRVGASSATASVELELPDGRILSVERTLTTKSRPSGAVTIRLAEAPISEDELTRAMLKAYDAEPTFIARLTMSPPDHGQTTPMALNLEAHLGRYYGIDGLSAAVKELKTQHKVVQGRIKGIKEVNKTSTNQLGQMEVDIERTSRLVEKAAAAHQAVQARVDRARECERRAAEMAAWQANYTAWTEAAGRLAARLAAELGQSVEAPRLELVIQERLEEIDRQIEALRIEMTVHRTKESTLTSNQHDLNAAHDDCPICRRPLDDATIALAHQANARDLATVRDSLTRLLGAESELLELRQRIKRGNDDLRQITPPGPRPEQPPEDDTDVLVADLTAAAETALNALVEARAAHVQATRDLERARSANEAMAELESLFRHEAVLKAAIETTEATIADLLNDTIRPLASEVNLRWQTFFPDRGDLNTYSDGNVTRTLKGHPLPYSSLSTGEEMGFTILLRILVAHMASKIDFCWFDEPLEHLDPDVRRKVANMLSRVANGEGSFRQIVVTTYEEPLARLLHARDQQQVKLVDVRQGT